MPSCTFPNCECGKTGYCIAEMTRERDARVARERLYHDAQAERGFYRSILILFVIGVAANIGLAAYMAMRYMGALD